MIACLCSTGFLLATCVFTTVLAWTLVGSSWAPVGSYVFPGLQLDSMFALQWALLGQVRFYLRFGVGSWWAPVFF